MRRPYLLKYPLKAHQEQIQDFLLSHPQGRLLRDAMFSLKTDPRPAHKGFAEIEPETEVAFLVKHVGIAVDKDTETVLTRYAPRCRIEAAGCEIVYDIDDGQGLIYLFNIQRAKAL